MAFAERLNRLFNVLCAPGRGPYSSAEVIKTLNNQGFTMSAPYLSQLRTGHRENPSHATIEQLAHFFRVDPAYFLDDAYYEKVSAELRCLEAIQDSHIRRIADRACGLSSDARLTLVQTIDELRRQEQLDDVG